MGSLTEPINTWQITACFPAIPKFFGCGLPIAYRMSRTRWMLWVACAVLNSGCRLSLVPGYWSDLATIKSERCLAYPLVFVSDRNFFGSAHSNGGPYTGRKHLVSRPWQSDYPPFLCSSPHKMRKLFPRSATSQNQLRFKPADNIYYRAIMFN